MLLKLEPALEKLKGLGNRLHGPTPNALTQSVWVEDRYLHLFFFFYLFRAALGHVEDPRLGAESELRLHACATATATPDLSNVYDLDCISRQCWILNPLIEARDQIRIFWILVEFLTH